ncbi:hypothetical protein MYCTH_91076 [Thermothelomyces thermophilus ATCC 42464]|uniref:Uncharacterized protein n=1 Tax=Thermothelomyces thermophilus (strain ATCC 42464 / BCRC 31852 / DSM 1799) TaxID=573729 RepID=G2Q3K5_THET4|nr:uncharacterized protein MYCTH_91076 [Thermothelomyces thermophilus ATCC 42464]AEO53561.1 hypothetical protein MYCTH_91076 [Thermothelomyces thermophilus ATCC 42464]
MTKYLAKTRKPKPNVEFDFYILEEAKNTLIDGYIYVTADVINELALKMLLGTDFITAYSVKIDFVKGIYTFRSLANIKVYGDVVKKNPKPISQKIVETYFILLPNTTPEDKCFYFTASRDGV